MMETVEPRWCDKHGSYTCCRHPLREALVTAIVAGSMFGIVLGLYVGLLLR